MKTLLHTILLLDLLFWVGLIIIAFRRGGILRSLGHCLAYHILVLASVIMVLPFYWMTSTSLKDMQGANQSPPTWLPVGTSYFIASSTSSTLSTSSTPSPIAEMEIGLTKDAAKPWDEIQALPEVEVAPIKQLNEKSAQFKIAPTEIRRERHPQWKNYAEAWNAPAKGNPENPVTFTRYFIVSGITAVATTVGTLFTSILAAYAFAKMRFRGRNLFFALVIGTMMVPGQVLLIPDFLILAKLPDYTFGMRWLDSYAGLITPWLASVFSIFLLRQFFINIPDDLWDAAQIDGAGRFRYLWQVIVPLSRPAMITAGIFIFLEQWNSLMWPLIVTTSPHMRTLMVGLQTFNDEMRGNFHLLMAAATIAVAPVVIVFFFLQRFFVEGIARTGIK